MSHKVFISHASPDFPRANQICTGLESLGLRCWIAPRDIGPRSWPQAVSSGIAESDRMIVLISRAANRSRQVEREVVLADRQGLRIIPICLDNVDPRGSLDFLTSSIQRINVLDDAIETQFAAIAEAARRMPCRCSRRSPP